MRVLGCEPLTLAFDADVDPNVLALFASDGGRRTARIVGAVLDQACARLLRRLDALEPLLSAEAAAAAAPSQSQSQSQSQPDAVAAVAEAALPEPTTGREAADPHRCEACGKVCKNKSGYSRHMLRAHAERQPPHPAAAPEDAATAAAAKSRAPHPVWDEDDVWDEESVRDGDGDGEDADR